MNADALLADLDADQRAAVTAESRLVAVIAGAGSGKTRVLTRRIAWRIATGDADPRHTLALTFTRQAAGELRRRLSRLGVRERVEAGTFHSVMLAVLKQRWNDTGRRPRTIVPDRRRLVGEVLDASRRRATEGFVVEIDWATSRGIDAANYPTAARRAQRKPSAGIEAASQVYADFEQLKRSRGIIDFDDVLTLMAADMTRDPSFAAALRWRFRHLHVDEAQDLNPIQHRLVDLLRAGRDDLFLVGDPAQAIFGFNGADPALLVDVEDRFPGVEIVRLPLNHRCSPQIVRAGVHVLEVSGQPHQLQSNRADSAAVEHHLRADEADEARFVRDQVRSIDPRMVRAGEVAVLARTNAQLDSFKQHLEAAGIATRRSALAAGTPLQAVMRRVSALGSASQLRAWAHDTLDAQHDADTDSETAAEGQVAAAVLDFLREHPMGDGSGLRAWVAMTNPFDDRSTGGVDLLTFHSAKGREWHTVFVTGVESSLVPHKSATTAAARAEEARLLYVAITRAADRAVMTSAGRRGGYARTPSPFLDGIDLATPPATPPPAALLQRTAVSDPTLAALRDWRDRAARRADVIPTQFCSDHDLSAIAQTKPTTVEALIDATSFGPLTARRLADQILPIVADPVQSMSTMTGA